MTRDADKGRTLSDLLLLFLQKFGLSKIALTVVSAVVVVWIVAHYSAESCKPVRVWGLFEYTKRPCKNEQPPPSSENETSQTMKPEEKLARLGDDEVLAQWGNGDDCFYHGTEKSTAENKSRVIFTGFGDVKEIGNKRIARDLRIALKKDLVIGGSIFVEFDESRSTWIPATIVKIEGDRVHAKLDTVVARTCGVHRQSVSVPMNKIIVAAPR